MTPGRGLIAAVLTFAGVLIIQSSASGQPDPSAVDRGRAALLARTHVIGMWPAEAYENAWKLWGLEEKPADYDAAFRRHYGLFPAPYRNHGLPMGLRQAERGGQPGLAIDCMLCHGGSICGTSYVGLPNTTLDLQLLFQEMALAAGRTPFPWPFALGRSRGTTNAGAVAAFVLGFRNPDLSLRFVPVNLGWQDMPDLDAPAWWLWKRKQTIFYDGGTDAQSTRSTMQFLLGGKVTGESLKALEWTWEDVRAYIWSLEPPKYPFRIDPDQAELGKRIFQQNCARCHGTYGPDGQYPNKIVPIDVIGTDRARYDSLSQAFRDYYNSTWFGEKYPAVETDGYQAPPLDGIWATAPYFHNGSVPTVYQVLMSTARPTRFRRLPTTDREAYDPVALGWKVEVIEEQPPPGLPPVEARKIFDTARYGKGNGGHPFGDHLSKPERMAVIEFLKTL